MHTLPLGAAAHELLLTSTLTGIKNIGNEGVYVP